MSPNEEQAYFRAWLRDQTPRTWHQVALTWNWDDGTEVLDWILDQPACDAGTALALYLSSEADWYADQFESMEQMNAEGHWGLADAQFAARICERWAAGHFQTYNYHPGNPHLLDRTRYWHEVPNAISSKALWEVPASLLAAPFRGEPVDLDAFHEGRPIEWLIPEEPRTPHFRKLVEQALRIIGRI
ncbi:MAG TPA: DUF4274 domain-containing protein [Sphingomicrobium sp.]